MSLFLVNSAYGGWSLFSDYDALTNYPSTNDNYYFWALEAQTWQAYSAIVERCSLFNSDQWQNAPPVINTNVWQAWTNFYVTTNNVAISTNDVITQTNMTDAFILTNNWYGIYGSLLRLLSWNTGYISSASARPAFQGGQYGGWTDDDTLSALLVGKTNTGQTYLDDVFFGFEGAEEFDDDDQYGFAPTFADIAEMTTNAAPTGLWVPYRYSTVGDREIPHFWSLAGLPYITNSFGWTYTNDVRVWLANKWTNDHNRYYLSGEQFAYPAYGTVPAVRMILDQMTCLATVSDVAAGTAQTAMRALVQYEELQGNSPATSVWADAKTLAEADYLASTTSVSVWTNAGARGGGLHAWNPHSFSSGNIIIAGGETNYVAGLSASRVKYMLPTNFFNLADNVYSQQVITRPEMPWYYYKDSPGDNWDHFPEEADTASYFVGAAGQTYLTWGVEDTKFGTMLASDWIGSITTPAWVDAPETNDYEYSAGVNFNGKGWWVEEHFVVGDFSKATNGASATITYK
jgi:hypothetical protein